MRIIFKFLLFLVIITACNKDTVLDSTPNSPTNYLDIAKSWYNTNSKLASTTRSKIDLKNLIVDWDNHGYIFNQQKDSVIFIPLKSTNDSFYREINVVKNNKGEPFGIIKEYIGNPAIENTLLNIYSGSGILLERAKYNYQTKKLQYIVVKNKHTLVNTIKNKIACNGCEGSIDDGFDIEEVAITGYTKNKFDDGYTYNPIPAFPGMTSFPSGASSGGPADTKSSAEAFNAHIDDSELPDCIKSIISILKQQSGNSVADIIRKFSGNSPDYNWVIKFNGPDKYMSNTQYGRTDLQYLTDKGEVTTLLNPDPVHYRYASDLAVAVTIIHESVHAYLTKLYFTDKQTIFDNYPEMVNKFFKTYKSDQNEAQHNVLAKRFVNDVAYTLQLYGRSKGYDLQTSFYEELAWAGLTETNVFKTLDKNQQQKIINTIKAERYGNNVNTNGITQKGKKIGCY